MFSIFLEDRTQSPVCTTAIPGSLLPGIGVEVNSKENESIVEITIENPNGHRDINSYYLQVTLIFLKIIICFYVELFPNILKIKSHFETTVDRFYSIFVHFSELNFTPFDDKADYFLSFDYFAELTEEEQSYLEILIKLFEPKVNKRIIKRKKNGKMANV